MFRPLRRRLVLLYVVAAVILIATVAGAVTLLALSTFAHNATETAAAVAREVPEIVRVYRTKGRTLEASAPDIVRALSRPGVLIRLIALDPAGARPLAASNPEPGGPVVVLPAPPRAPAAVGREAFPSTHDPLGLTSLLRLERQRVPVPGGVVIVIPDTRPLSKAIATSWAALIPIAFFVVLAAWLLGRYITNQAVQPLVQTTAALQRFAGGDFTPTGIVIAGRSEFGELVQAYNGAANQVAAAFEERRTAELQMRQFIADAGHELRTPLTVIMGFIDVLRRRASGEPAISLRIFDTMTAESRRMRALIDKLIFLARLENHELREETEVDLARLSREIAEKLELANGSARLVVQAPAQVFVHASSSELHEAIANLIENAYKYAPDSQIDLQVRADRDRAIVEVSDKGPGLSAEDRAHVFDRFYRGANRGEAEGFGLGLAIAKRAVERASGEISVDSTPGSGCTFRISLPRPVVG